MSQTNAIALDSPFAVELTFKLQSFDLDSYGFASEFAYLRWLGSLRQEFLQQHFDLCHGKCPVLVSTQIEHKQSVQWPGTRFGEASGDLISGRLWLSNLGKTRWTLQSRLESAQKTIATAIQVGHLVDADTLTPLAIPEALAQQYWDYQWRQSA